MIRRKLQRAYSLTVRISEIEPECACVERVFIGQAPSEGATHGTYHCPNCDRAYGYQKEKERWEEVEEHPFEVLRDRTPRAMEKV